MKAALEAAARYRGEPSLRGYAIGKCALDPAYGWLAGQLRDSAFPLLDIGCGAGVLAGFLRASGHRAPIIGIDLDNSKIEAARRALPDCRFQVSDARDLPDHAGDVVMLDVIHYFSPDERSRLIARMAGCLAPGARLFLRTTLRDNSWRFAMTRAEEWFVRASGWIPFASHSFAGLEELAAAAGAAGLHLASAPMWGLTPFNSYMLTLTAPPVTSADERPRSEGRAGNPSGKTGFF